MIPETPRRRIVVGFDASPASRAALSEAVARAQPDGRIVVVHAYDPPSGRYDGIPYQRQLDAALSRARALLANLPEEVPGLAALEYGTELLAGPAATAIARVADAERASEIIVGTRGFGRARALLGSTAHDLIHRARCPVTVIPARALALRSGETPAAVG